MPSLYCICCNRPLSVTESIQRGLGPICAARKAVANGEDPNADKVDLPYSGDIVAERREDGLHFNIYPIIAYHSPTGFEIGYGGSGPADFALNILELFLRDMGEKPTLKLGVYKICEMSWNLHQDFKWAFIASMDPQGGVIKGDDIRSWIEAKRQVRKAA